MYSSLGWAFKPYVREAHVGLAEFENCRSYNSICPAMLEADAFLWEECAM